MRGLPITSVKNLFESSSASTPSAARISISERERPPPSYTKNMLAKFQSMQDSAKGSAGGKSAVTNGDNAEKADLPQQGTTKSLLAKFRNIQQESVSTVPAFGIYLFLSCWFVILLYFP